MTEERAKWTGKLHPLDRWIVGHTTRKQFCADVGCSYQWLSEILRAGTRPSVELVRKIIEATGGEVGPEAFPLRPDIIAALRREMAT
jgi:hypothetical protein